MTPSLMFYPLLYVLITVFAFNIARTMKINIYMFSYFNLTNYNISITLTDKEDQEVEDDNNLYHHLCAGSSSRTEHAER